MSSKRPSYSIRRLAWTDPEIGGIDLPRRRMEIRAGFGSGLSVRRGDPPGVVWAVGDRGPNLKVKVAIDRYGLTGLSHVDAAGAKVMPMLDAGPAIAELQIREDRVELVRILKLTDGEGRPISGLPVPGGAHADCEPALDLEGHPIEPDPSGADTEGIAALPEGGFWVGDEYGPSLMKLDGDGRVERRLVPEGLEASLQRASFPIEGCLPAIAARRQLNRGFEALTVSPDGRWLYLAFQSPLAHPDEAAHEAGRHIRIWRLDATSGGVHAQFVYPLDPPHAFRRDIAKGEVEWSDLKVSEITAIDADTLLVLERCSETTKIYRVRLSDELALPAEHLDIATRPTLEELSAGADTFPLPVLSKELILDTDDAPEIAADLEGMVLLTPCDLLLVNDNDFGVEGANTGFWRIRFDTPLGHA